jgi:hypothetical protein
MTYVNVLQKKCMLELKNIKYTAWASEETNCYQASLYLDGKKIALVSNDGHGGCDNFYREEGVLPTVEAEIHEYFKTLPRIQFTNFAVDQDLETWCGSQVERYLSSKDLKRHIKKGSIIKDGKNVYTWKHHLTPQMIKKNHPDAIILNDLRFEEALDIFMEGNG